MPIEPGSRLGHYEIVSSLGAGGMGEVYRAQDTQLGREVAIKLLLEEVSADPERMTRFEREARVLASLNHPNIATLHGFEKDGDTSFLVMELVEGETLADRIARGPVPVAEAIPLFIKIADGLEAAHQKGVIHRDLKPANLCLTKTATVKILDFGLAKALERHPAEVDEMGAGSELPTLVEPTRQGQIVGTPAFMSPEQAQGEPVDVATDVWAFGCCLYTALTGAAPFRGSSPMQTLARILESDIDWAVLPRETPPSIRRLLERCLVREPGQRLQSISDARLDLADATKEAADKLRQPQPSRTTASWRSALWAVPAFAIGAIIAGTIVAGGNRAAPEGVKRFTIDLGSGDIIADAARRLVDDAALLRTEIALSPSGERLAYVSKIDGDQKLYLLDLADSKRTVLEGTDGAFSPFFSPDGNWLGFYGEGQLKKVDLREGTVVPLADATSSAGGVWLEDDTIVFSTADDWGVLFAPEGPYESLRVVTSSGGQPVPVSTVAAGAGELAHSSPAALPGGGRILFTVRSWRQEPDPENYPRGWGADRHAVAVLDLGTGEHRTLIEDAHSASYSPTGHLLFIRDSALWAVPFDAKKGSLMGAPTIVEPRLHSKTVPRTNMPYAVSTHGDLVFLPDDSRSGSPRRPVRVDTQGRIERLSLDPDPAFTSIRPSPDGTKLALVKDGGDPQSIWIHERSLPGSLVRISPRFADVETQGPHNDCCPVWTPDSVSLFVNTGYGEQTYLALFRADGAGTSRRLTPEGPLRLPCAVSPDGLTAVYQEMTRSGGWHLGSVDLRSEGLRPREILRDGRAVHGAKYSPDGRWLLYAYWTPNGNDVWIRRVDDLEGGRWLVTAGENATAWWSADGSEIFFLSGSKMRAVSVQTSPSLQVGSPRTLFEIESLSPDLPSSWAPDTDGEHFLMLEEAGAAASVKLIWVENWSEHLDRLNPTG